MLSHGNCVWTIESVGKIHEFTPEDCTLSYLPLSHIAEQVFTIHGPAVLGIRVYFAEALEKVPDNLKEVQPTLFFGVPRIWEKFHAAVRPPRPGHRRQAHLVDWARASRRRVHAYHNRGKQPPALLALQYKLAQKPRPQQAPDRARPRPRQGLLVRRRADRRRGARVLHRPRHQHPRGLRPVRGQRPDQRQPARRHQVRHRRQAAARRRGPPRRGRRDPRARPQRLQGLLQGPGRHRRLPHRRLAALRRPRLLRRDGFLLITGRKKEIIITAGGKNIAPKNIEAALKNHPLVEEAVVIGDRRHFISALLTLDAAAATKWLADQGKPDRPAARRPRRARRAPAGVDKANQEFARVEQVRKFRVLPRSLASSTAS
jgi:long-chain acyl-CoA synthetase